MDSVASRLEAVRATIPAAVTLVAVSKFHPAAAIAEAYAAGQRVFGESRVQELAAKQAILPDDIRWHFIGHLQSNKVRAVAGRVALIESVDSERLLELIDRAAEAAGTVQDVLLEVHVAAEATKSGFSPDEILDYFGRRAFESLRAVHIRGIMGMATNTDDPARVRADFDALAALKSRIAAMCPDLRRFDTLSMGMSGDYPAAVAAGSTTVRVGTAIFGPRP